ncbi:hypothetical protein AU476_27600 [Cupriavidus sp. UYMSc13B]|nr:hypothetical protein AU476_27600 [Cupriavidus sp. UYMSc13B]
MKRLSITRLLAGALVAAVLAGCASPEPRYYTLAQARSRRCRPRDAKKRSLIRSFFEAPSVAYISDC